MNGKCDWLKGEKPGGPGRDFQGCKVARLPSSSQGKVFLLIAHLATQRTY